MDLTISIVSHENRDLLQACLKSVYADIENSGARAEVCVVVNVPGDGSADMVLEHYPRAIIIENDRPLGFAVNHNQVLRSARGRFVMLLNDDTELHPGCLRALLDFCGSHPDTGAAGPRTLNPDGSLQQSCYRLPTLGVLFFDACFLSSLFPRNRIMGGYKLWPHDTQAAVGHVIGACLILPRAALDKVGLLDENFFLYYEEADLCKRLRDAGYKTCFVPQAVITHHAGASIGRLGPPRVHHFHHSMNLYYAKHFGRASLIGVYAFNIWGAAVRTLLFGAAAMLSPGYRERSAQKRQWFKMRLKWYFRSMFPKAGMDRND